jgi:predicted aspartyl protease
MEWMIRMKNARLKSFLLFTTALLLALPGARAAEPILSIGSVTNPADQPMDSDGSDGTMMPLVPDTSTRMTVEVKIGGQGPFPFIVDSGAERSVLTEELATLLALARGRDVRVHGFGGSEYTTSALVPKLELSHVAKANMELPLLQRNDVGADGILGSDMLQSQRILIDFQAGTMNVTPSQRGTEDWEGESITVTARRVMGQLVLVDAALDETPISVIVDTGAQVSVGNEALKRRLLRSKNSRPVGEYEIKSATGDVTLVSGTVVRGVRIGGVEIHDLPIGFADAHLFRKLRLTREPALLLGMDALKLFDRVSIDFGRRRVRFARID